MSRSSNDSQKVALNKPGRCWKKRGNKRAEEWQKDLRSGAGSETAQGARAGGVSETRACLCGGGSGGGEKGTA